MWIWKKMSECLQRLNCITYCFLLTSLLSPKKFATGNFLRALSVHILRGPLNGRRFSKNFKVKHSTPNCKWTESSQEILISPLRVRKFYKYAFGDISKKNGERAFCCCCWFLLAVRFSLFKFKGHLTQGILFYGNVIKLSLHANEN